MYWAAFLVVGATTRFPCMNAAPSAQSLDEEWSDKGDSYYGPGSAAEVVKTHTKDKKAPAKPAAAIGAKTGAKGDKVGTKKAKGAKKQRVSVTTDEEGTDEDEDDELQVVDTHQEPAIDSPAVVASGTSHTGADTAGSGGMALNRPASAREELTGLESTLDCCSALAASVREKSVHLLSRMDANVRTGVKTSEAEAGAGGQAQVEELLVYA